ncbi:MAG: cysteine desulfurase [Elusimicrobiota bacterium]
MSAADSERLRADFPSLQAAGGKRPVYFDNACTTLRPLQVVEEMNEYYLRHPSCHKRSVHAFGRMTDEKFEAAREAARAFINAEHASEIIFTRNTTEGINLIAGSYPFKEGDTVVTTDLEHNSNLIPWRALGERKGVRLTTVPVGPDGNFDLDALRAALRGGVKLVSVFSHSHVLGIAAPLAEIARLTHAAGGKLLVDAAQTPLHEKLDVRALAADFLVLSFHKMLGPSGMGLLYGRRALLEELPQFLTGGETVEDVDDRGYVPAAVPHRFEAGLQNYAGAMGAHAAIRYLDRVGFCRREHEIELNEIITEGLAGLDRFRLLGPRDPRRRGSIVNFYLDGMDSGELSILLDKTESIMTRSGVHCCHAWYRKYRLPPTLRASLAFYNTREEAELFVRTLKNVSDYF